MAGIIGDIAAAEPAFTVERFEPDGERLEVAGHWRGLRGRRFVRPVLWLYHGEDRQRLVAVLDHKPWAVGEGAQWVAAFPWSGGKLEAERAELEVGTELVVQLPVPGAPAPKEPQTAKARQPTEVERLRGQLAAETKERRALQESLDKTSREADTLARLRAERDAAREEAEHARADGERLVNDEYRQRERALAATEEALVRQREAEAARDLAERQLGAARTSHSELEAALAATEAARADLASRLTTVEADRTDLEARLGAQGDLESRLEAAEAAQSRPQADRPRARARARRAGEGATRMPTACAPSSRRPATSPRPSRRSRPRSTGSSASSPPRGRTATASRPSSSPPAPGASASRPS